MERKPTRHYGNILYFLDPLVKALPVVAAIALGYECFACKNVGSVGTKIGNDYRFARNWLEKDVVEPILESPVGDIIGRR